MVASAVESMVMLVDLNRGASSVASGSGTKSQCCSVLLHRSDVDHGRQLLRIIVTCCV